MAKEKPSQIEDRPEYKEKWQKLLELRNEAMKNQEFKSVVLSEGERVVLELNINPSGTPVLVLRTYRLTNRIVLPSVQHLKDIVYVIKKFSDDSVKFAAVTDFLAEYGYRPRRRSSRVYL